MYPEQGHDFAHLDRPGYPSELRSRRLRAERYMQKRFTWEQKHRPWNKRRLLPTLLKPTGLWWIGFRNALKIRSVVNDLSVHNLPDAFDGTTLLQLSDLHIDEHPAFTDAHLNVLERLNQQDKPDYCVITGDIRARTAGEYDSALAAMARLRPLLPGNTYAILGNHDTLHMLPGLESLGIRVLLNESLSIRKQGAELFFAGVDDPSVFDCADLREASRQIPDTAASILLAHSPVVYQQAMELGFGACLTGHTHGGQICLPRFGNAPGYPVRKNVGIPWQFCSGPWRYLSLHGYTSRGSGTAIAPIRFNCPPEITLHRLCKN